MKLGQHLLADAICAGDLSSKWRLERFARDAISVSRLTIRSFHTEEFSNGSSFGAGLSVMAILSESHLSVHTSPQRQLLSLDLFSCQDFPADRIRKLADDWFDVQDWRLWMVVNRG